MKELWKNLKKVYEYSKDYKKYLILYLLAVPFLSAIGVVIPIFTAKQLEYINGLNFDNLLLVAAIILVVELSRNLLNFMAWRSLFIYFKETQRILKMRSLKALFNIKNKELDGMPSGVIIERVNSDCNKMSDGIPTIVDNMIDILVNLGVVVTIFVLNKIFFAYLLVGALIVFFIKRIRIKKWYEYDKLRRKQNEHVTSFICELIRGLRDIKVLDANESFLNTAESRIKEANEVQYKARNTLRKYDLLSGSIQDILDYSFMIVGILLLKNSLVNVTVFVTIYLYKDKIYNMFNVYTRLQEQLEDFQLSTNRVVEIIDGDKYERESFGTDLIKKAKGDFEFKHVKFSYKENMPVLKDISFKVDANTTVGFVGKSGTGKTTIFNLLAKLYEPSDGVISIDGKDINDLDEHSIRGNMTIINQSPYIFNMSIYDNLKLVNPKATKKQIREACRVACLEDFIENLPDKYNTMVGEGGISLSGGQRQRLAIARALIQNTEIILFDEATSALDNETQKSIQEAIDNMKGNYTIMIIAHRFSTVVNCDKIIYMENGKIKGEGTHAELLKTCKGYKNLYELELKNNV